jgi:hypothetical protein
MNFELLNHQEIVEEYQGINLNEFKFPELENIIEEELITEFIYSNSYKEDCLTEIKKKYPENKNFFLRQAFEIDNVLIKDFRKLDKKDLINFLNDLWSSDDWGDTDSNDFLIIKDKFIGLLKSTSINSFYLLNKDWFKEGDLRIREPERWIYSYYFLIIWIDKVKNTLLVSEWAYD